MCLFEDGLVLRFREKKKRKLCRMSPPKERGVETEELSTSYIKERGGNSSLRREKRSP